jgi:hypothetical protein
MDTKENTFFHVIENKLIFNEMIMSKYNIQIVQKGKSNKTQIHAGSVFWFDTDTSIKSGG